MTSISLTSETETRALGAALAQHATLGDVITLSGPLGAGKTVVARGFIIERLGKTIDVASPTFTLVHVYDTVTPEIWHFDLYRLDHPDDVQELGLDDALATGISLIEWADKAAGWLPQDRLDITLTVNPETEERHATLECGPGWSERMQGLLKILDTS